MKIFSYFIYFLEKGDIFDRGECIFILILCISYVMKSTEVQTLCAI